MVNYFIHYHLIQIVGIVYFLLTNYCIVSAQRQYHTPLAKTIIQYSNVLLMENSVLFQNTKYLVETGCNFRIGELKRIIRENHKKNMGNYCCSGNPEFKLPIRLNVLTPSVSLTPPRDNNSYFRYEYLRKIQAIFEICM